MLHRLLDLTLAILALLLFSPLLLLLAALLFVTQRKILFFQSRPGLNEAPFTLIKFSTMYDVREGEDEAANQLARLTPIGKYLRKWSLDELPQLWNVIRGDMALVGPRPLLMEYLTIYTEEEHQRHLVKPGITGWAQVHGRNFLTFKQRFQYDLWYVRNRSIWLDLKILLMTIGKVFRREGVYANEQTTSPKFDGTN
ncbi:MAG: sugar transferase [Bacteroidota bacterium]